jgi:hypothetical protein
VVLCGPLLTKKLTDQFRHETHVGCVDGAVQTKVRCLTGGALLDAEQWRILGRAVRLADHQISLIALDVNDLVETKFELIRADDYDRAAQRSGLPPW